VKPPDSSDSTEPPSTASTDPDAPPDTLPPHIVVRQDYLKALRPHQDHIGRRLPWRLSAIKMLARWTDRAWKAVPSEFWALDLNAEGYSEAVISCVCGSTPHVEVLCHEKCPGCYRWFLFGGDRVLVAYGEMPERD
jgi:hypothetical protein